MWICCDIFGCIVHLYSSFLDWVRQLWLLIFRCTPVHKSSLKCLTKAFILKLPICTRMFIWQILRVQTSELSKSLLVRIAVCMVCLFSAKRASSCRSYSVMEWTFGYCGRPFILRHSSNPRHLLDFMWKHHLNFLGLIVAAAWASADSLAGSSCRRYIFYMRHFDLFRHKATILQKLFTFLKIGHCTPANWLLLAPWIFRWLWIFSRAALAGDWSVVSRRL